MKKILCFGDSNILGFIPESGKRYPKNIRWTGILQGLVQNDFEVIEAGCNTRTAFADNPCGNLQTGFKAIPPLLTKDLDCIILAIGINDLQFSYNQSLEQIQDGIEKLIVMEKQGGKNMESKKSESDNQKIHIFLAPGARVVGDVTLGENVGIWYNAVKRGDLFINF